MTPGALRKKRQLERIEADHETAYRLSGGGKRVDESGTFIIPALIYRTDPWERAFLIRHLAPVGSVVSKPVYQPAKGGYEFEWRRTTFKMKGMR